MRCQYCEEPAVFRRKISNEVLCKVHYLKSIEKKIRKTVRKFQMFTPRDKVVVGVSGGKDSLVLLKNVIQLQRRYPQSPPVEAILIDEGIRGYRAESVEIAKEFCTAHGVPLHIVSFADHFGDNLDGVIPHLGGLKINACTICGTVRRRLLNDKARELKADKLAIGHNLDDQVETFLQNIIRNDLRKIISNPPNGNPDDPAGYFIPRVKPLMYIPESEIVRYCFYGGIPIQSAPCPYVEGFSILRKKVQEFVNDLEKQSAEVKYNLITANEEFIRNFHPNEKKTARTCHICGSPCGETRNTCYYCDLREQLGYSG